MWHEAPKSSTASVPDICFSALNNLDTWCVFCENICVYGYCMYTMHRLFSVYLTKTYIEFICEINETERLKLNTCNAHVHIVQPLI